MMADENAQPDNVNGNNNDSLDGQQSPNVWSPSCQRRNLRLDLSCSQNNGETVSPKSSQSPVQGVLRSDSKETNSEPTPAIWQPFGEPLETPQFRSVKIETLTKKSQETADDNTTQQKKEETLPASKADDGEVEAKRPETPPVEVESDHQPEEGKTSSTSTSTTDLLRFAKTTNLPQSQSPTVTLLQKARTGQITKGAVYIDEKSDPKGPLLPKNAVLIDQKVTIEGDKVHTDSYYAVPTVEPGDVTTHTIKAPPKYDGIGPTEYGIPVGLRTGVKDEYASDWYKTMYRSLHKGRGESRGNFQTVHYGGYMSEPEFERTEYRKKREVIPAPHVTAPEPKAVKTVSTIDKQASAAIDREYIFDTPTGRVKEESYKNQPRSIAEYEPGRSSLADREFQKHEHFRHSPRPQRSYDKKWPNALLCDGYDSDSTLIRKSVRPAVHLDPEQQKALYKEIQKGGDIPFTGLRKPAPSKPKESLHQYQETQVNIHYKSPIRNLEKEYIEEEELRQRQEEAMKRFYEEERLKKKQQQAAEIEMRRHCDNFTPSQKSPISLNRYDNPFDSSFRSSPDHPRTLAQALYPFVAQTTRELSLNKGDIVYINRQIDKNWFEGEHHGFVGIFPVAYVTVIPTEKANFHPKDVNEGYGIVKYNFRAKTPLELSLFKGERVILIRRIDQNWFEGRLGTKKGIFPVSYIDVIQPASASTGVRTSAVSPKPDVSPISSPNGSATRTYLSTTITKYEPEIEPFKTRDKTSLTQVLNVDTYNEPIPYRSLYSYRPQNDDELELKEGDTVYVMEKCDDGWYVGTSLRTGLFGTFPGNYVERI